MRTGGSRTVVALALQLAALAALALALVGASWLDPRSRARVLVLVDRSQSVPRAAADRALEAVVRAAKAGGAGAPQVLEFAGRPGTPAGPDAAGEPDLEPSATHLEAALDAALAAHARAAFDRIVVVSDGLATVGDTERALRAVHDARLPLQWIAVGREPPPTRLTDVLAPDAARVGQRLRIAIGLAGDLDRPLRVEVSARGPGGHTQAESRETRGADRVEIELDADVAGALVLDVALRDPEMGDVLDTMADAAVVDVAPPAAILYGIGSTSARAPLARSLVRGGWKLKLVPAGRLDADADQLDAYQAVVLDDVAIADASPRFWNALVAAVHGRGVGLLVLGGERSFASGGYRDSALESVLPVTSEPPALDEPVSIVFAVDKSGSMGRGSGGIDRFRLAQRAVLESARSLTSRDALGLLVFDVAPRLLIPLGNAAAAMPALGRDWPTSPNGGTKLVPALEAAIGELERSGAGRRMLVLVTDGFADDAPPMRLRERLARARIETIALAVGPDADAGALARIVGAEPGQVLRVAEAAELPLAMRSGIESHRARVERGTIGVLQHQPLPFAPATLHEWPAVGGHAVTRPRPEATVAVQSERGEPLIAYRSAGRGRVMAVTCGLGPWTARWLRWREWPRLAGGLASGVGGGSLGPATALAVSDRAEGLQVEAEVAADAAAGAVSIAADGPATPDRALAADLVAPGRVRATLPDGGAGLYTFLVSAGQGGVQRHLHLKRHRAETGRWGASPELDGWRRAGLVQDWDPAALGQTRGGGGGEHRPVDRSLMALSLALCLAGVVVDRTRLNLDGLARVGRRLRAGSRLRRRAARDATVPRFVKPP